LRPDTFLAYGGHRNRPGFSGSGVAADVQGTITDKELRTAMTESTWLPAIVLTVLSLVAVACGQAPAAIDPFAKNGDGYVDITVEQLAEMMEDKDFTLVNVHIPYTEEIEQTDLRIPFDQIADHLDQLPDKQAPIVLYCRSGSMSTVAAKALVEMGYANVMELDGGFNAWKAAGHKLLTGSNSPTSLSQGSSHSPQILFEQETIDLGYLPVNETFTVHFDYLNAGSSLLTVEPIVFVKTEAGC
jgi:rhodanese-related sulfurtransferase